MPKAQSKSQTKTRATAQPRARAAPRPRKPRSTNNVTVAGPSEATKASQTPVDSTQWRESRIRIGTTISKGTAMKQYRLKAADLKGLDYDKRETVVNGQAVDMHLYQEREVERKAWQRHGGPDGFEAYLEKLRKAHVKKGKFAPFTQPAAYAPAEGSVHIVTLRSREEANYDPHVGRSPVLLRLKQDMPRRLWDSCHRAMDRVDDLADPYDGTCGEFSRTKDREGPMRTAANRLAHSYPVRPTERLPSSPALDRLRDVLAKAPSLPRPLKEGADVTGLSKKPPSHPDYVYEYDWGSPYLDLLLGGLIDVIETHGTGAAGWGSARWEVYDKYSECLNAMSYHRDDDSWFDHAAQWLDGKYVVGDDQNICFLVSARSKSSLGEQYNSLLPTTSPVYGVGQWNAPIVGTSHSIVG